MDPTLVLMISAAVAAILHTLVPDHEIPLAMIGRAQNWSIKKMAGVTLIAGAIHISASMGIGTLALIASVALAQYVVESAQQISGFLLIVFGIAYAFISWRRRQGGHTHSHGADHVTHGSGRVQSEPETEAASARKPGASLTSLLVAIVGIAPCFTLIPVLVATVPYGATTIFLVMLSYAVATIGMMVTLTSIALKAIQYVTKLEKVERHLEILAGVIIFAVGVWLILEISLGL